MQRRRGLATIAIAALSIILVFSLVGGAGAKKKKKVIKVNATLSGQQEVPPADPDGTGEAKFKLKKQKKQVCFNISFTGIQDPFVAHIHPGAAGVNGPPLITLFESTTGTTFTSPQKACVDAAKSDIKEIGKHPDQFYVNIHNDEFATGAIRGQLAKKGSSSGGGGGNGGGLPY